MCFSYSPLLQARSKRPPSTATSVIRPAPKQSFQVHVDEDAEQTGHVGQTVGSQVLSVRKSDLEASNNPLKVLSSVSIRIGNQRNGLKTQAKSLMTDFSRKSIRAKFKSLLNVLVKHFYNDKKARRLTEMNRIFFGIAYSGYLRLTR